MGWLGDVVKLLGVPSIPVDESIGISPENWGRQPLYEKVESTLTAIEDAVVTGHVEKLSFELGALAQLARHEDSVEAFVICSQLNELARKRSLKTDIGTEEHDAALRLLRSALECAVELKPRILSRLQVQSTGSQVAIASEVAHAGAGESNGAPVIRASNLTIAHPGKTVLQGVNLNVHAGEVVLIVGRNGSGKSTLLRALAGEMAPVAGVVTYPALEEEYRHRQQILNEIRLVNPTPATDGFHVQNSLYMFASLRGITKTPAANQVASAITQMSLDPYSDSLVKELSTGYRTRFELAKAMIKDPRVLLLDEPLAPLDAAGQRLYLRALRELAQSPKWKIAIVIAAQNTSELEGIANRVVVLSGGAVHPLEQLLPQDGCVFEIAVAGDEAEITEALETIDAADFVVDTDAVPIRIHSSTHVPAQTVLRALERLEVRSFRDVTNSSDRLLGVQE